MKFRLSLILCLTLSVSIACDPSPRFIRLSGATGATSDATELETIAADHQKELKAIAAAIRPGMKLIEANTALGILGTPVHRVAQEQREQIRYRWNFGHSSLNATFEGYHGQPKEEYIVISTWVE